MIFLNKVIIIIIITIIIIKNYFYFHYYYYLTAVPPQNQADSYKRMEKQKWVFGVEHLWVLAPTRHGAHNWEGPGELTAMAALRSLAKITEDASWAGPQADANYVVIAGHSMGGHGAW